MALLASDVALENQTEVRAVRGAWGWGAPTPAPLTRPRLQAVLQKYLDHNGTLTGALLVAIGGSRLCWMSARQIQAIRPSEFR